VRRFAGVSIRGPWHARFLRDGAEEPESAAEILSALCEGARPQFTLSEVEEPVLSKRSASKGIQHTWCAQHHRPSGFCGAGHSCPRNRRPQAGLPCPKLLACFA
jgi:hypothetical protein